MSQNRPEFTIRSRRVITHPDTPIGPARLRVRDGRIAAVEPYDSSDGVADLDFLDFGDAVVMPGIVDTHAHINEPGRTDWEGFQTATRAAAAGGITSVVDMPLNSIPATTTLAALKLKAETARGKCAVDYGFWGGVVPGNAAELEPMIRAGALGFKCFLCPSGVDEFEMAREADLRVAMPILAKAGVPLLVHAEIETPVHATHHDQRAYRSYLESRPQRWEVDAVELAIRLARETGCRTHIVHLSAADALGSLERARKAGVPITAETCPHYLALASDDIRDGATQFKCAPPIRDKSNQERLWKAVREGLVARERERVIEFIVSDHSPCTPDLKRMESGDFGKAWGGIAGLQFSLPVVWTEMSRRGFTLNDLQRLMSERTARFIGLGSRKGHLKAGADADFVVFHPESRFKLERAMVRHRHSITPYEGRELLGRVERAFLRGREIDFNPTGEAHGQPLSGPHS